MKAYSKYKDSGIEWIGEIPEEWNVKRIKSVSNFINGFAFNSNSYCDSGVKILRIGNIKPPVINLINAKKVPIKNLLELKDFVVNKGDILLALTGATIGKSAMFNSEEKVLLNQRVSLLRCKTHFHQYFLKYFLITSFFEKYVEIKCFGGAQENIGKKEVENFSLLNPSMQEQQKIAEFLDDKTEKIEKVILNKKEQIELLKENEKIIINNVATKGLDKNVELKESGVEWLGKIPEEWDLKRFSVLGDFSRGKGIKKDEVLTSGLPCVRYGEIYTKYNRFVKETVSFINGKTAENSILVKPGSVLFAGSGETVEDIGKAIINLSNQKIYSGGDIIVYDFSKNVSYDYMSYVVNSNYVNNKKSIIAKGGIIIHIYAKGIKDIKISFPSLLEQKQIAEFLDKKTSQIQKSIEIIEGQVKNLEEYKKILINNAVTGKIKVF